MLTKIAMTELQSTSKKQQTPYGAQTPNVDTLKSTAPFA